MRFIKSLLFLLFISVFGSTSAQDIHWSLYNMSPLTLNPANTGAFNGTFRIGGIYRDQARSVLKSNAYVTPSFYVDAPIIMVGKKSWLGVGGMMYNDEAGSANLSNLAAMASAAIHIAADKKAKTIFSFGLQAGTVQRRIDLSDPNNVRFEDELNGSVVSGGSPDRSANVDDSKSYFDVGLGALLTSKINKEMDMRIGLGVRHLLSPKYNLDSSTNDDDEAKLKPLVTLHGLFNIGLNEKWTLSPSFLFHTISGANNIQVQGMMGYHLNEKKDMTFKFGAGYRLRDAAEVLLGLDYKQFKFGVSYDATLSGLSDVNNSFGGFEIAASYIAKIFKKPPVKPVIHCPRF